MAGLLASGWPPGFPGEGSASLRLQKIEMKPNVKITVQFTAFVSRQSGVLVLDQKFVW